MRGESPKPQSLSQLETAEETMPATLSKAKNAPFFNAKKHTFSDNFKTLPHKGKCLIGVKIELIGNEKRPILIFEDARVDEIESPTEAEFAGVLRSIFYNNTRPKFVFQSILHPNPFSGRQYCRYSPSWMRGTHLGKLTIEADVWMKLLASNIKPVRGDDGEITFVPWNENTCLNDGIKTWHDFRSVHSSGSIFLECKEVEVCETDDGLLFPTDPIMQIKSKASPKFGDYLSSIYDDVVADGAIVFERVRELPKMIVIAEWLKKKGVEIDDEWLWEQTQPHPSAVPETFQSVKSSVEPLRSLRRATRRQILKSKICTLAQIWSPCKKEKVIVGPYGPIHLDAKCKVLNHLRHNDQHKVHAVIEAYVAGTSVLLYELPVTVLASSNDEDIDWVYGGLPEIPIDRSPFIPDVASWSELHEQSIDPFCSVFVSKRHEESADVIRRGWNGGCSMESFDTKRVGERERECRRPVKLPLPMDFSSSTGVNSKEKDTVSDLFQASGAGNPLSCKSESKCGLAKVPADTDDAPLKSCVYLSQPGLPQPGFPLAWSTKFDIKEILSALNNPFAATLLQYAALNGKVDANVK